MSSQKTCFLLIMVFCGSAQASSIEWRDCKIGGEKGLPELSAQCARFEVPENPAEPSGLKLSLNLARVPARAKSPLPDPVFFLAGGPGQAAIESFPQMVGGFRDILSKRDVILVDQRGTGGSARLECKQERSLLEGLTEAPDLEQLKAETLKCLGQLKADPRFYSTSDYIRDLQSVRAALGLGPINLYGGSYGTRVALSYLKAHPDALRALIIDGVAPQDLALGSEHARNLESALLALDQRCRKDSECTRRFGDLKVQRDELKVALDANPQIVEIISPTRFEPLEVRISGDTLIAGVRLLTYAPETIALLPILIHESARDGGRTLARQALMTIGSLEESLSPLMELSVICTEDVPFFPADSASERNTLMGTTLIDYARARCSVWPRGDLPKNFKDPVVSDKPVLLLSGEFDPVTPPRYAEHAAKGLSNSRHLVAPGQGHIALFRGCMGKLAAQFLNDLKPAELKAECLKSLTPAPLFSSFNGSEP